MTTETFQNTPTPPTPEMTDADFIEMVVSLSHKMREATATDRQAVYDYFINRGADFFEPIARLICFGEPKAQEAEQPPASLPATITPQAETMDYAKQYRREHRKNMVMRESLRRVQRTLICGLPHSMALLAIALITSRSFR